MGNNELARCLSSPPRFAPLGKACGVVALTQRIVTTWTSKPNGASLSFSWVSRLEINGPRAKGSKNIISTHVLTRIRSDFLANLEPPPVRTGVALVVLHRLSPLPCGREPLPTVESSESIESSETVESPERPGPAKTPRIFPLYLTPFEEYMVWDDRADYPMTFVVKMEFDGTIDRDAITRALPMALRRHPLLQANVKPAKGNRDCWVAADAPHVEISWGDLDESLELPRGEAIDLRREIGLRVWIRTSVDRCVITTQFHHATCDGIGAYQMLGDWLWFYADLIGDPVDSPLPPLDPLQLRMRVKASYNAERYKNESGKIVFDRAEAYRMAIQTMQALAPRRTDTTRTDPTGDAQALFPGLCDFEFDKLRFKKIRHVAEARGQSTNELLIQQLLVSLNTWAEAQSERHRGQYCIMMPMDLRESDTRLSTAANLVTYALIRRRRSECVDSPELVNSLSQELLKLKHTRHQTTFMNAMAFLVRLPIWLKRGYAGRRRMATAIVSNTGDPTKRFSVSFPSENGLLRAGNLVMTDINGVPPMRHGTCLTISVFTYRRVLKICLRCDPKRFTVDDSRAFLNHYVASIEGLLECES